MNHPNYANGIVSTRNSIDTATKALASEIRKVYPDGNMPVEWEGKTIPAGKLVEIMEKNLGSYVRREYLANWVDGYKPTAEQWDIARKGFMETNKNGIKLEDGTLRPATEADANSFLQGLLDDKGTGAKGPSMDNKINKSPYMARDNVPPWQRQFMGEITDPAVSGFLTIKSLSDNIAKMKTFGEIAGNKEIFFDKPTGDAIIPVLNKIPISNDKLAWGAIAKKYVTPEIADYLGRTTQMQDIYDQVIKSWIQTAKKGRTTWNIPTHGLNVLDYLDFANIGGISPLNPLNAKYYKDTLNILRGANNDLRRVMVQNSIIGTELPSAELINNTQDMLKMMNEGTNWTDKLKGGLRSTDRTLGNAYQMEEQIFKIAKFLKEMDAQKAYSDALVKAGKQALTDSQMARNATSAVYRAFPNYNEVSNFAKGIRQSGGWALMFPFSSYPSEAHRILMGYLKNGTAAERTKLAITLGWRGAFNLAALTAAGVLLGSALGLMWKNNQFMGSLADPDRPNRVGLSQRGAFNIYTPHFFGTGTILGSPIEETAKRGISGLFHGINRTVSSAADAVIKNDPSELWNCISPSRIEKYK